MERQPTLRWSLFGVRQRRFRPGAPLGIALSLFAVGLKLLGLFGRGVRNALDIRLTTHDIVCPRLPSAFDGYVILHVTDPHFDALPGLGAALNKVISRIDVDLCLLTGDYRHAIGGPHDHIVAEMACMLDGVRARDGVFAILGNHDCAAMVEPFEALGVKVLANESVTLERGPSVLHLTGIDDVHYYFTPAARQALFQAPEGFRVALVHSPEMAHLASEAGHDLYLTGHTHGGQVALPGGRPILTHLDCNRHLAAGLWRYGAMIGYTGFGAGVSGPPVRFNTRGEIAVLTLRKAGPDSSGASSVPQP
jgi:hypothetical protein